MLRMWQKKPYFRDHDHLEAWFQNYSSYALNYAFSLILDPFLTQIGYIIVIWSFQVVKMTVT